MGCFVAFALAAVEGNVEVVRPGIFFSNNPAEVGQKSTM